MSDPRTTEHQDHIDRGTASDLIIATLVFAALATAIVALALVSGTAH